MTLQRALLLLSILSVVGIAGLAWQVNVQTETYRARIRFVNQTVHTTWRSGGITQTVSTTRAEGESADAWAARHKDGVDAMLKLFPKDPG